MIVNALPQQNWKHTYKKDEELKAIGFRYDYSHEGYVYRFPVFKDGKYTTLECLIIIRQDEDDRRLVTSEATMEVVSEDGMAWAPFYTYNSGYEKLINSINQKIIRKLSNLGIFYKKKGQKK